MDSSSWCYELGRYVKLSYEIIYVLVFVRSMHWFVARRIDSRIRGLIRCSSDSLTLLWITDTLVHQLSKHLRDGVR